MKAIVDSSALIAVARPRESAHVAVVETMQSYASGDLGVPATILGETMSFLRARLGIDGQCTFWDAFMRSGIEVIATDRPLLEAAREIDRRYSGVGFGFADCTLLATCESERCARVLSLDLRLAAYRPSFAPAIELLP